MINFQLGQAQARRVGTGSTSAGQGLQGFGRQVSQAAQQMNQLSRQAKVEDPSIALTYYIDKAQQLDTLEQDLKKTYTDPFELNEAIQESYQAFSAQTQREVRELGIPKKGTEKLLPRMIASMDNMNKYRTDLFTTAGKGKLKESSLAFRESMSGKGVATQEETVDRPDGTTQRRVIIKMENQNKVRADLLSFASTADEIGKKYALSGEEVNKFLEDEQAAFFDNTLNSILNTKPEILIDPRYNGKNVEFAVEQVFLDPITGEPIMMNKTLTGEELMAVRKQASALVREKQKRADEAEKKQQELATIVDLETTNDILQVLPKMGTVGEAMAIIDAELPFEGLSTKFQDPENKQKMMQQLQRMRASGGIPRDNDPDILEELELANALGELVDPYDVIDVGDLISKRKREELLNGVKANRGVERTEFQRNLKEQTQFVDSFWGNFTNFVGTFDKIGNALGLSSKTQIKNRALALPEEQRTREKLQEITFDVLVQDAENAVKSRMETSQLQSMQQLSLYNTAEEIELAIPNSEDKALALFFLKIKQFKQEKVAQQKADADALKNKPKEPSFMDKMYDTIMKKLEGLGQ